MQARTSIGGRGKGGGGLPPFSRSKHFAEIDNVKGELKWNCPPLFCEHVCNIEVKGRKLTVKLEIEVISTIQYNSLLTN